MGAWGARIFDDDTACEVRDDFVELLAEGRDAEAATRELERRYAPAKDPLDVGPVFWLALAAAQYQWGRLVPQVRDRAIAIIEDRTDLERFFDDPKLRQKRARALADLKTRLNGPPRPARKVKPLVKVATPWTLGQVLRYRLPSGGTCLFRVTGHREDKGGRYAVFEVLRDRRTILPQALRVALTAGARDKDGRLHELVVPSGLETSGRVSPTGLGDSLLAPVMRQMRDRSPDPRSSTLSVVLLDKLDLNLKTYFDLE